MAITIDFTNTNVVVVGGTSGINRGIAEAFATQGARVAVASRSLDKVNDTVTSLQALGAQAMGFCADVRDIEALAAGLKGVHQAWGDFDIVVSGAAGNFPATVTGMSSNAIRSVLEIDLLGSFHVMQAIHPYLKKPGASVINISAPQAFIPCEGQTHVCAAKAGVDMITRCLSMEWGSEGVRVNSVVPGPIEGTEGMARLVPKSADLEKVVSGVPLRRLGRPEDVAGVCLFLGSQLGGYVTGAVIPADGGWSTAGTPYLSDHIGSIARQLEKQS